MMGGLLENEGQSNERDRVGRGALFNGGRWADRKQSRVAQFGATGDSAAWTAAMCLAWAGSSWTVGGRTAEVEGVIQLPLS
jgi:hypothetical protein